MDIHLPQSAFSPEINPYFPASTAQMAAVLGEAAELASLPHSRALYNRLDFPL